MRCAFLCPFLFQLSIALLQASSWGSIGGPDIEVEGEYADLTGFYEETVYEHPEGSEGPHFITYSNTPYALEGYVYLDVGDWNEVTDEYTEYTFTVGSENAPTGTSFGDGENDDSYTVNWTAPYVTESTIFSFSILISILEGEQILETLEMPISITVLPALPQLDDQLLSVGFRIRDYEWGSNVTSLEVIDPDEAIDGYELRMEGSDPRFTFERNSFAYGPIEAFWKHSWGLVWNDSWAPPVVSEILPLRFWMKDFDGVAERWTLAERKLMIFGYHYEEEHFVAPTPSQEAMFGSAVELMDDLADAPITSFVAEEGNAQVHIYEQSAETGLWLHKQTLNSPVEDLQFGSSLSSTGDLLAIGAPSLDYPLDSRTFIYQRDSASGNWSLLQTLQPDDEDSAGMFGGQVVFNATDGTESSLVTLMVSADGANYSTGAVWVYESTSASSPSFSHTQVILPNDASEYDYFGWPLALKGDIAAIPANEDDDLETDSGAVYVYRRDAPSGLWGLQQKLKASDTNYGDQFGERVAISKHGIFVAAFRKRLDDSEVGAVYQFKEVDGTWEERGRLRTIEENSWGEYVSYQYSADHRKEHTLYQFGSSLVAEGDTVLIAGRRESVGWWFTLERSVVYQFDWDGPADEWSETRVLCSLDSDDEESYGLDKSFGANRALAIKHETILVGDIGTETSNIKDSGMAFSFLRQLQPADPEWRHSKEQFLQQLQENAPDLSSFEDDADFDGHSNLKEFYAGTDPTSSIKDAALQWTRSDSFPDRPTFSFLQSRANTGISPEILMSHTLEPGSWTTLNTPRYLPDAIMDTSIRKTIDLSHLLATEQPVFLKIHYPEVDLTP